MRLILGIFVFVLVNTLFANEITISGSVISENQKMISSRYMGYVKEIHVSEGDLVKKGSILYTIDSREIDAQKAQIELALKMQENQYENVRINLERHKRLLEKDMVSKYEVENLELAEKNLKNMIAISKEQLNQIQNQYNYLVIKAPNDGVVVSKNIKVGEMALPGVPAIILSDLSHLRVQIELPESNLKDVSLGKKVKVEIPSANLITDGKIAAVVPTTNPMTHTFLVKIDFDKQNKPIYPGMFANVRLEVGK